MLKTSRRVAILAVSAGLWAPAALAADRLIIEDQVGQTQAIITGIPADPALRTQDPGPGAQPSALGAGESINIYRSDGTRAGYGIQRPDGSVDLFRPDGSRLGAFQPGTSGQPARITIQPGRRR